MARVSDSVLKTYFETGDVPTQDQFASLIDSKLNRVATISDLISLSSPQDGDTVYVEGYHTPGDGGGGVFRYDASESKANHNGGTIIDPTQTFPTNWSDTAQQSAWFTASGSGNGCWKRFWQNTIHIKWFGAKVDGVTDDSLPLFKAYLTTPSGGLLCLPSGTVYVGTKRGVNGIIDIEKPITIKGSGFETTIKGPPGGDYIIIYISGTASGLDKVLLSDFTIDGNNGGQLDAGLIQIDATNFVVDRVWVRNTTKALGVQGVNGIAVASTSALEGAYGRGVIKNCIVSNVSKPGIYWSSYAVNGIIDGCFVYSNSGNGYATGIAVAGSNAIITNNVVWNNEGNGIQISATSIPYEHKRFVVSNNIVFSNGTGANDGSGIYVATPYGTRYGRGVITNNIVYENGVNVSGDGITIASEDNIIVNGNYIYKNSGAGIQCNNASQITIRGNVIEANNTGNTPNWGGVVVRGTSDEITIRSNKIFDSQTTKTQTYGISLYSGTLSNINIDNNELSGNQTGEIYFGSVPTIFDIEYKASLTTTDATPTNVFAFAPASNTTVYAKMAANAKAVGGASNGAAFWNVSELVFNDGGTISQVGTTATIESFLSSVATSEGWTVILDTAGGTGVRGRVIGGAANTVEWEVTVKIISE